LPLRESEAKILLALLASSETPIMALPKKAGLGSNAVYNSIRWLTERHLVHETREEELPRRRFISLSDDGRKIAELLKSIEEML
jgi:DNA-binding MarR family transcriptional regulator